jgi:hypothetical protein
MVIGTEQVGYNGGGRAGLRASAALRLRDRAPRRILPALIPGLALELSLLRLINP